MPNFAAIYALNAGLRYLGAIGLEAVTQVADPLTQALHAGLLAQGITPMAPRRHATDSGIVAFQHPRSDAIQAALQAENIHVMHQAGRLRVAVHGYNTEADITHFLSTLDGALQGA
jgi:selenocysteine lyase/cysteine desulfurase